MFNPVFTNPNNALLQDRLNRITEQLRNTELSTAEDYAAEIYSAINTVISLGLAMTPLTPVGSQGPAVVGDVETNYTDLNNDAQDIANEMLRVEDLAATAFNEAAASQNQLRQQIRQFIYTPNQQVYVEDFVNENNLTNVTANVDFNAAVATNALVSTTPLIPTISIGPNSVGSLDPTTAIANLTNGQIDTVFSWNGTTLELFLTFPTAQIMNRLILNLDNYNELEIDTFTTSPDGNLIQDVLEDLGYTNILIDGTSNKFSGVVTIDFPPRYILSARLIINDRTGAGLIAFRQLSCLQLSFSPTGQLTSIPITAPTGTVIFTTIEEAFYPYTSITHQISYNGSQFSAINPGDTIALVTSPFFYRATLSTNTSQFTNQQGALIQSPLDPVASPYYTLSTSSITPLGSGLIERTLQFSSVNGPIVLRDTPLANTLIVQEGSVILSLAGGDYTFDTSSETITFPESVTGITISYQTSSLGNSAIQDLVSYYTPLLYEYRFEVA